MNNRKNPNNSAVYIDDENMQKWKDLRRGLKSGLINWALKYKLDEYMQVVNREKERAKMLK